MTSEQKILQDWLAAGEWRPSSDEALPIPEAVFTAFKSFLAADHVDMEALDQYQAILSKLFGSYRKLAPHMELLGDALIKLGTCSKAHFWRPAVLFLNMAPGLGSEAIRTWVKVLHLNAEEAQSLSTELFHAYR